MYKKGQVVFIKEGGFGGGGCSHSIGEIVSTNKEVEVEHGSDTSGIVVKLFMVPDPTLSNFLSYPEWLEVGQLWGLGEGFELIVMKGKM